MHFFSPTILFIEAPIFPHHAQRSTIGLDIGLNINAPLEVSS
jgi:hypothetical protein